MPAILRFTDPPSPIVLQETTRVVAEGGLIAVPTESFYGLGASVWNEQALARIIRVKGRLDGKPLLVLIGAPADFEKVAAELPPAGRVLVEHFWPGPLTLVVPAAKDLPVPVTAGTGTVGVRLPGLPQLRSLLCRTGPMTGTSANRAGAPPSVTVRGVLEALGTDLDVILDGGYTAGAPPSTVVTVAGCLQVLREGAIPAAAVHALWRSAGYDQGGSSR